MTDFAKFVVDYPNLDPGIKHYVAVLRSQGVETFGDYVLDKSGGLAVLGNRQAGGSIPCPECEGQGYAWGSMCGYCGGSGFLPDD